METVPAQWSLGNYSSEAFRQKPNTLLTRNLAEVWAAGSKIWEPAWLCYSFLALWLFSFPSFLLLSLRKKSIFLCEGYPPPSFPLYAELCPIGFPTSPHLHFPQLCWCIPFPKDTLHVAPAHPERSLQPSLASAFIVLQLFYIFLHIL